ncbi:MULTISPECIES: hypothetical protein [Mycobacterium]|uniref:hypothetical protein n=1 Tax=Mycobacterium TaxID=1763 RepID=UPI0004D37764|nr:MULTISPECIES: hypothetical protein [Mycobacterium]KEF99961.1 hypothetical protein K883_00007 [Mycobacterium sp. TKK-01-0059]
MPNNTFPVPAGALRVYEWQLGPTGPDGAPNVYRRFVGSSWGSDRFAVGIDGLQHGDGSVERFIYLDKDLGLEDVTAKQARRLARALIAAADDYDRLNDVGGASK